MVFIPFYLINSDTTTLIFFWAFPCGSGCSGLRYRFGAALLSALANATRHIPNALRHSNK